MWHYVGGQLSRQSLLSVLARNQTKAWARDLDDTGSGHGNAGQRGVGRRNPQKAVSEGWRRRQSTTDSSRGKSAWDRVQEQWGKTSQDESAFLVFCGNFAKNLHISNSLHVHKECRVSQLNLALVLTQAHIVRLFFVLFLPLPWLYFLWP